MWKYVTRGIRETLERRASCRTNVYSQTSESNKSEVKNDPARNQKFLVPAVTNCNNGFFGNAKTDGPRGEKNQTKWDTGRSWSEAVGWSSALAVGWVVCQSLCLRRRLFEKSNENRWRDRLSRFQGVVVPPSLVDVFTYHRNHVLPVTNCVASRTCDPGGENLRQQWAEPAVYGPITIEEALKEARDNYTKTHRVVMGEFELRFGVRALKEKRYKDAVDHFSTGASLSSSGSMFNLGLCHELGIGTVTDPKKAAKHYRDAAEKGHPDAMYNLGVFHAQGRGGMTLDIDRARELFVEAADLGQIQARVALELEKNFVFEKKESIPTRVQQQQQQPFVTIDKKHSKLTEANKFLQMAGYQRTVNEDSKKISKDEISYYNDDHENVQNSTDMFLRSLGIKTNSVPILVGSTD